MALTAITLMAAPVVSFAQTCGGSKDSMPKCECKDGKCGCKDGNCSCGKDCKCEKCGHSSDKK
jgi:hypothetical protein